MPVVPQRQAAARIGIVPFTLDMQAVSHGWRGLDSPHGHANNFYDGDVRNREHSFDFSRYG